MLPRLRWLCILCFSTIVTHRALLCVLVRYTVSNLTSLRRKLKEQVECRRDLLRGHKWINKTAHMHTKLTQGQTKDSTLSGLHQLQCVQGCVGHSLICHQGLFFSHYETAGRKSECLTHLCTTSSRDGLGFFSEVLTLKWLFSPLLCQFCSCIHVSEVFWFTPLGTVRKPQATAEGREQDAAPRLWCAAFQTSMNPWITLNTVRRMKINKTTHSWSTVSYKVGRSGATDSREICQTVV